MDKYSPRILIVDDDPNMIGTISDILKAKSFEPIRAMSGGEALAKVEGQHVEVALIDLRLGDMPGMDVLRGIKARSPRTECILLTGYASQNSAIEAIQAGAFGYFQKPFDIEQVLLFIQRAVEKYSAEEILYKSEQRYRGLFEDSPIAIWEEDFSEVKRHLDSLKQQGVTDFQKYFASHPDVVFEISSKISVLDINNAAVQMFKAESKEALIEHTNSGSSKGEAEHNHEDFMAILEGRTGNSWEGSDETLDGEQIEISLSWSVVPGYENDYSKVIVTTIDITERKRAEEALRKNEALLSEAQRIGKIGHWEWSAPEMELICSDELFNLLEIPRDGRKISQNTIGSLMHPEDLARVRMLDREIFSKQLDIDYEYRVILPGDKLRWIHQQAQVSYNADGQPARMMGVLQDITERKAVDEAWHKSDAQYRLLANNISDVIWILDLETMRFTYVSPSVEQLRGFTVSEALAQDLAASFVPDSMKLIQKVIPERLTEAQQGRQVSYTDEVEQPRKDGTTVWTEVNTHYHFNSASGHWEVYGVSRNISERKFAEKALRKNEERYRLLFESAPVGIFSATLQGEIIEINPTALQILGSPSAEATKAINLLTFPLLVKTGFSANFKHCIDGGQPVFAEQSYTSQWGKTVYAQYRMTPIRDADRQVNLIQVIIEDITERKLAEDALRESEKRYYDLFEDSPIALREEDFSEVKKYLDQLKEQGVTDFKKYFDTYPEAVFECASKIRIVDVNKAALKMFQAENKYAMPNNLAEVLSTQSAEHFKSQLAGIAAGEVNFNWEGIDHTIDGRQINVEANWSVAAGHEKDLSKVIVSLQDITERKHSEKLVRRQSEQIKLLYETSRQLNRTLELKDIYQAVCDFMGTIADNDGLFISAYDPETQLIACRAFWMDNKWMDVSAFPPIPLEAEGKGTQSLVIRTGLPMLIDDYQAALKNVQTNYYVDSETTELIKEIPPEEDHIMRSALIAPLRVGGVVSGVIQVMSYRLKAYTEDQLKLLEALALQISSAEQNALLYSQVQTELNERKQAEANLRRLNRLYATFSEINQTIVHVHDRQTLFEQVCRVAVEYGQFRMAWIGLTQAGGQPILPVAFAGDEQGYLKNVRITYNEENFGRGPTGTAIREGRCVICQDIATNPLMNPWQDQALSRGYRSSASLPIFQDGRAIGAMSVYSGEPDGFDAEDEKLLDEIGKNISFALNTMQIEARRAQAEEELRVSEQRYRELFNSMIDGFALHEIICDENGKPGDYRFVEVNPAFERLTGLRSENLIGKTVLEVLPKTEAYWIEIYGNVALTGRSTFFENYSRELDRYFEISAYCPKPNQFAVIMVDITERKRAEEATHQRVVELELLYEGGLAFSQLLNPREIAKKIIYLLEQKMNWHHTAIRLYNSETKSLQLLAYNQPNLSGIEEAAVVEEQLKISVTRLDQGVSGWVVQHGQTVRSNDLTNEAHYVESLPGMHSGLYVPIKLGDQAIGVISIESEQSNAFSEADERLTNTLASQAASAMENARLFEQTRLHVSELTALHHTGQTLLAARLNAEQIFAAVHQAVGRTMPCDAFVIVLDDEERGEYHAVYSFDKGERYPVRWLPRGRGLSGRVISSGEALVIQDATEASMKATHFGTSDSSRSVLAVPLRRGDAVIGMLSAQSYQPNVYGEPQRVMLETIGTQLSSALDNTDLYQQTRARIRELEILHVISTSLRSAQTVDEALSTLLDNTLAAFETDAGTIMLYHPSSNELRDTVARGWFANLASTPIKYGEGVAGTVCATGTPYFAAEFVQDSLPHISTRANIPTGWGGGCLPIRTSTEIIGVMFVSVHLPRQINSEQIKFLESLAEMAGAAVHRMRLFDETARRAEEFASLYEMNRVLSAEYDLDTLLEVIAESAKAMLNSAASGMYLYDAERQELVLKMDTASTIPIGTRLSFGEGAAGKVAQTRQPLRIDDYSNWEGRATQYDGLSMRAVVEVPMLYAGELIGVLTAEEILDSGRKFTEADERLLSLFATQAAGAINAARHREHTIRHAEELEERVIERTAEIEATRKRLDLAARAGGIGVWEIDTKENKVFFDKRMHFIHGTESHEFDNTLEAWWAKIYPDDLAQSQTRFVEALQKTGIFSDEHRIIRPDGSLRFISVNGIVLSDAEYNPERMIGVAVDITDRKQVEETLHRANIEMERALRTKDEFLANMSHELRTPLNAILGISESLEEQFVGPLNEKQLKYTGIIRESGRHLLELINDILDISKIEAGRFELEFHDLSVEKICQSSLRMIKELAKKKELGVSFEIKGGVTALLGDERRLKQSLVNLLGNAVKFTPHGGAIGLEVNGFADINEVTFTVWDTGVGIASEDIKYLFKPFVQLDGGLAREYQGTGLGLALVAQMIRLHGGRVHVESALGKGSRFIVTLPWLREQQTSPGYGVTRELPRLDQKPVRQRSGRILLVEDTNVVITLMSEYLIYKGYDILVARNGLEGVQIAKDEHPDLILMDVMMPVLDGLEATKRIRADRTLQKVPIIALTALAMPGDREFCLAAGMNDYMSKPIKMQELSDMVEKHLGTVGQDSDAT
ncbi:MAG: GAF domain-containing protein [Chloroflexi bacterium]|nr:GAF domain-containing protein [Chloroflexota bacterium]